MGMHWKSTGSELRTSEGSVGGKDREKDGQTDRGKDKERERDKDYITYSIYYIFTAVLKLHFRHQSALQ